MRQEIQVITTNFQHTLNTQLPYLVKTKCHKFTPVGSIYNTFSQLITKFPSPVFRDMVNINMQLPSTIITRSIQSLFKTRNIQLSLTT